MNRLNWLARACGLLLIGVGAATAAGAQTFKTLASFDGTNGQQPLAPLVQGTNGNLYGTTNLGGAAQLGTIFRITPGGTLTTLYSFCSQFNCADGTNPYGGLALGTDGNLYGTTFDGGTFQEGTIFRISPSGSLTTLYSFCNVDGCPDGALPQAGLVLGTDGNFYGTTAYGGTSIFCSDGCGTAFKITPGGVLTTVYSFCPHSGCADGYGPASTLALGTDGNFYGTTLYGGDPTSNAGTVFKLTPGGALTTLYTFCAQTPCTDGETPWGGLVQARDGNFYGTTYNGGALLAGTVFRVTASGALTTLLSFAGNNGQNPEAALVQATDGNLYGTTVFGNNGCCGTNSGTVFRITLGGKLTTLYTFCLQSGCPDGSNPTGALVQGTNGTFYGTTSDGGGLGTGDGTVFSLGLGLGAFVKTLPTSGKVGATVIILGNNLKGSIGVTFNGTPAAFTVVSGSEIKTTVPGGATTGKVQVTAAGGTKLTSNLSFQVR
ncbi:MAG TPA: choice-of-anchor tandem repeat GloVer-containing protein [Terriglobia bacterium]|nr:choice-of-anchor tandem repeat GloVer-containing protein [Terriglobia bacterium]